MNDPRLVKITARVKQKIEDVFVYHITQVTWGKIWDFSIILKRTEFRAWGAWGIEHFGAPYIQIFFEEGFCDCIFPSPSFFLFSFFIRDCSQGWLQGGWGGCIAPHPHENVCFLHRFVRSMSFHAREYYVPLTISRHTP